MTVNDPDTGAAYTNNPAFTLQAWVKFPGSPQAEGVFYSNGPGGAISFR
jgi:hypothetical protein